MPELPEALAAWAQLPGPAALLAAVRVRAQRGHQTETGRLTGLRLTGEQRGQLGQLLGVRWELSGLSVRLQDVAARLAEHGLSVFDLAEAVHGSPIEETRVVRDRAAAAAEAERTEATTSLATAGVSRDHIDAWLADPGLPKAGGGELAALAAQVADVWRHLLGLHQPVRLAQLAADLLHDAHALDAGRLLGRVVARLAATVHGLERPQRAGHAWREAWAAAGVRCDGVSSRVLVLNLPLHGNAPAAAVCAASRGEPVWLTLRSMQGVLDIVPTTVFTCENPTVAEAAADALGPSCPPLLCTDGIASGAALDLLAELSSHGCTINARADIDPAGFVIMDQVRSVAPHAHPWRFDTSTYFLALGLTGNAADDLRLVYDEYRLPLHEERILDFLLTDLAAHATPIKRPSETVGIRDAGTHLLETDEPAGRPCSS